MPVKLTTEEFIKRSREIHGDDCTYDEVVYFKAHSKVKIFCKKHNGFFFQSPTNHLSGQGCPKCISTITKEKLLNRFVDIHGEKYNYNLLTKHFYKPNDDIDVMCKEHGIFTTKVKNHVKYGCRLCGDGSLTKEKFIEMAMGIHGDVYDYSKVEHGFKRKQNTIICKIHGEYRQTVECHLRGHGCRKCGWNKTSTISNKEKQWLDINNIDIKFRQYDVINGKYRVDGFDPETKTVYEFYGDYWHGNPRRFHKDKINYQAQNKTFGELYEKTLQREAEIKAAGYKVISIWESDYDKLIHCPD